MSTLLKMLTNCFSLNPNPWGILLCFASLELFFTSHILSLTLYCETLQVLVDLPKMLTLCISRRSFRKLS